MTYIEHTLFNLIPLFLLSFLKYSSHFSALLEKQSSQGQHGADGNHRVTAVLGDFRESRDCGNKLFGGKCYPPPASSCQEQFRHNVVRSSVLCKKAGKLTLY